MGQKVGQGGTALSHPPKGCSEEHVQAAVARVLDELGVLWFHPPNEALQRGGLVYGGMMVALGVKKGVPDVIILDRPPGLPERVGVALELKTLTASASPEQRRWISELEKRGWVVDVPRGTHAALYILAALGWDVTGALQRLADRGEVLEASGRLARQKRSKA